MKQTWVCWWYLQWSYALADRRQALWAAEAVRDAFRCTGERGCECCKQNKIALRKERRVNKALVKVAKWRKRGACENCRRAAARLEA